jgi:RHS repeat-associated protein
MRKLILLSAILLAHIYVSAGVTVVSGRQKGPYNATTAPLGVGGTTYLQDDQYTYMLQNPTTWDDVFTNCNLENRVILRYEESARVYYGTPWSLAVQCTLKKWNSAGSAISPDEYFTLTIDYDPAAGTTYNDKDVYVSTAPGYKVQLIVGTITPSGSISAVPADVVLETEIEVSRRYVFTQTSAPSSITNSGVQSDNTFNIRWAYLAGAESYDLEFLHVSDYDAVSVASPDFTRATRINTPNQSYTLNLAYDDGYILYRVRGVGYDCGSDFRKEGVWSSNSTPVSVNDIDPYRNWQYTAVYTEDGKRRELISFYDGTGKQRQAVTLNNTDNAVLVGETMYDYEGRAAIQTLPAPEDRLASQLMYYQSFSLVNGTSNPYTRKAFDTDDLFNTSTCTFGTVPGMDDASGASNYYSPDNDLVNTGMYQALPDAQLYPFVQTVYGKDGRPVKQSAPGADHNIGSGQEVESFYTTPTQERIDRLFGNEVGYAEHYNQVMTVDPNGQMSVSYLDLSGRVIATSLVGQAPANLDALASNSSVTLEENFNANNIFDQSTGTWMVNAFYMVSTTGTYTFTYTMTTEEFIQLCTDTFDCVYDLEINIYDGCDNPMDDVETPSVLGTAYVIDHATVSNFTKTFTVTFSTPGVYRVEKKLSLNQQALDDAVTAFVAMLPSDCFQTQSYINDSLNSAIDSTECQGCDSSCIVKGIALGLTGTPLTNFIDSCQAHDCDVSALDTINCDAMLDVFAGDLTPGGQYFDNVPAGIPNGTPTTTWLTTYVWADGSPTNTWTKANFRDPSGNLIDSWAEMRQYWQNGWATQSFTATVTISSVNYNSLVEFHPEYCHYTWCTNHYDDQQFDLDLFTSDDDAWASSYPSGTGNAWTYNPAGGNEEGTNMVNADPFFNTSPGSGDKTAMQAKIDNYSGGASMWSYAGTQAGCTSCDAQWIMFRSIYIAEKAQYSRARENTSCGFLCDTDVPPNFYVDNCSAETNGFMIRIPDLVSTLSTQPSSSWNSGSQTIITCNDPVTEEIDFYLVNGSDHSSGLVGTIHVNFTDPLSNVHDLTCGLVTVNGQYTMTQIAAMVAAAINSCVNTPYDFTAYVDPNNPEKVIITGPASAGSALNNTNVAVDLEDTWNVGGFKFEGGTTGSGIDCITYEHCFCKELALYEAFYNATNDSSGNGSNYIVNHTTYTTAAAYIAYVLNSSYGTSVTSTTVAQWMAACDSSDMADPTFGVAPALEDELDCENPVTPCMEDGYDITSYYAGFFYQQLVEQATQDFIQDYIDHCFGGNFSEDFEVEHPDREYHFTLYYYDQAGNLTRTVPPHAVDVLDATETANTHTYRTTGAGSAQYPTHKRSNNNLVTNYKYNSFNNPTESATPDGGTTLFYYDNLGRLVASENSKQTAMANYVYSYTFYDAQSRIYEVGQVTTTVTITASVTATMSAWETFVAAGTREQVTSTYYDETLDATTVEAEFYGGQNYLRKRVTSVTIEQTYDGNDLTYEHATHFSYDVHGNVNELIQDYPEFTDHSQQFKHICYEYDLISNNVDLVMYNHDPYTGATEGDQFYHQYYYDADNRLTNVYTSVDSIIWEQDAKYIHYLHGPLGRSEVGDVKVQGSDYAYTIHGWIKGVNANELNRTDDLGKDAQATNSTAYSTRAGMHSNVGQDAYGYTLGYYWDNSGRKDYKPINNAAQSLYTDSYTNTNTSDNLFNGNIKEMSTAIAKPNGTSTPQALALICNHYHYDQLNRIKQQLSYTGTSTSSYASLSSTGEYRNDFTYDAAGNISMQFRNGTTAAGQSMDDLDYYYYTTTGSTYTMTATGGAPTNGTNKLAYVDDAGTAGNYTDDLEDQSAGNYTYDEIGNLIDDNQEQIDNIVWNVYGKISSITRDNTSTKSDLIFIYDAFGQRIGKIVKPRTGTGYHNQDRWTYTYYVRDASGNVMATYTRSYTEVDEDVEDKLKLSETHLYGASRLGIKDRADENIYSSIRKSYSGISNGEYVITGIVSYTAMNDPDLATPERTLGYKQYEFTNHLGNVLVTLSDRKTQVNSSGTVSYFMSDVRSYSDYSAFGVALEGRHGGTYRYDFNGKESDIEADLQDYGMRIYNPRLGKFLSVDPLMKKYAMLAPYQFAGNSPVHAVDLDGMEPAYPDNNSIVKTAESIVIKQTTYNNMSVTAVTVMKTATGYELGDGDYVIRPSPNEPIYEYCESTTIYIDGNGNVVGGTYSETSATYSPEDANGVRTESNVQSRTSTSNSLVTVEGGVVTYDDNDPNTENITVTLSSVATEVVKNTMLFNQKNGIDAPFQIAGEQNCPSLPPEVGIALGIASLLVAPEACPLASALIWSSGALGTAISVVDYVATTDATKSITSGVQIFQTFKTTVYGRGQNRENPLVLSDGTYLVDKPTVRKLLGYKSDAQKFGEVLKPSNVQRK